MRTARWCWTGTRSDAFIEAAITGDHEHVNAEVNEAMALFEMVWDQLDEHISSMDDYESGKLAGRIVGEAIGLVGIPGGAGAKAAQMLTKLRTLDKFNDLRQRLTAAGHLDEVLGAGGRIERFANDLTTTRMCFVAGTMVVTARGLVAIECVEVGDRVWSRDEHSGEEGFRAVIDTIRTSPRQLVEIRAVSAAGSALTLTGTAEHPFYVAARPSALDEAGFVPMGELLVGDALVLSGGAGRAHVTDVRVVRGPPTDNERLHGWDGRAYRTFNIEVEEWHTYFVRDGDEGGGGVWVHNSGNTCERIKAMFVRMKTEEDLSGVPALERFLERTDTPARKALIDPHLKDVIHEVMNDYYINPARRLDGTIDLSKIPTYAQLKALADANPRIGLAVIEVHHTVPEYLLKVLIEQRYRGTTTAQFRDDLYNQLRTQMPGYLVHQIDHTGTPLGQGAGSFHSILTKAEPAGFGLWGGNQHRRGSFYPMAQIRSGLQGAYNRWQRPEVWNAAEQWLRENDLIP